MGIPEYSSCVWARGHNVEIREFFSKHRRGLRSLQERQLNYEVETQCKYEQELEDLKARMKVMKDMFHGLQSVPTDHQTGHPPPEEVPFHHQIPPSTRGSTLPPLDALFHHRRYPSTIRRPPIYLRMMHFMILSVISF